MTRMRATQRRSRPGLGVAGIDDQAMEPGVEALRLPQRGQVPPGPEQRLLRRVLGAMGVAQDPVGERCSSRRRCRPPGTRTPPGRRPRPLHQPTCIGLLGVARPVWPRHRVWSRLRAKRSSGDAGRARSSSWCFKAADTGSYHAHMPEERRLVTVLFADVTGSTALGESLDPEDLRALLARYFAIAPRGRREPRRDDREVHRRRGHGGVRAAGRPRR